MARGPKPPIEALEVAVGHIFVKRELLKHALTHVSAIQKRTDSYQRLEFLGDRVLGLAVAGMLYEMFPDSEEGDLSRRLARHQYPHEHGPARTGCPAHPLGALVVGHSPLEPGAAVAATGDGCPDPGTHRPGS